MMSHQFLGSHVHDVHFLLLVSLGQVRDDRREKSVEVRPGKSNKQKAKL